MMRNHIFIVLCHVILFSSCDGMIFRDLFLPEGSTWKVGVFTNNHSLPSDHTPEGNVYIFDEKCNVTIVFHEVYQELEAVICHQVDQMKANFRALLPINLLTKHFFRDHCLRIRPHQSPVIYNYEGPILLMVRNNRTIHIKDRSHLRKIPGLAFNATYELRLKTVTGMTSHIDASVVDKHVSCETNGIPVLVARNESFYDYICDCKYSTYGPSCEWGPLCPRNKKRELCSFRGSCKQRGDVRTCICDSEEYHGSNCIHFTFFTFYNCCRKRKGECCHKLPTKITCSCAKGFRKSKNGKCVKGKGNPLPRLLSRKSIIKSITSSQKNEMLEMCCFSCERNVNFTFYKDNHAINEVPVNMNSTSLNLTVWEHGDIEIIKLHDGNKLDSMMCLWIRNYSEDDFGLYSCNVQNGNVNEGKAHYVLNKHMYMDLSPQKLTVFKGSDVSVKCRVRGAPFFEYDFNFNWTVSPVSNFESMSIEPYFFQGSNIFIKNIQGSLNIECNAGGAQIYNEISDYFTEKSLIKVITKNDSHCDKEELNGIIWQYETPGYVQEKSCPMLYNGTCLRKCYINCNNNATWDLPDCSNCQNTQVVDIFKNIRMYKKGILSYGNYSIDVLPRILEYMQSKKILLHGELGYVVKWLQNTLSIPRLNYKFETFSQALNLFVNSVHSLKDTDLHQLENLIRMSGEMRKNEACKQKYFNDTNIISLMVNPVEGVRSYFNFNFKLSPKMIDTSSQCKYIAAEDAKIEVNVTNGFEAARVSLIFLKNPSILIPFLKKVYNDSWKYPSIGNGSSALLQIDAFAADRKIISWDHIRVLIEFSSCRISGITHRKNSQWTVGCARYIPRDGIWSASDCEMKMLADGKCSCSCRSTNGWIGLVCYKEEKFMNGTLTQYNLGTVLGCGISFVLLSITTVCLLYHLSVNKKECFSRLVEVVSVLIVDIIFLYQSIEEPRLNDNLIMLIIISSLLVLSLGVSVSHHVSIVKKCSLPDPLLEEATEPFLVVIISFLSSAMLGVILWTISKVQQTKLTKSWLPNSDASILTLVVLCYIYALIFMLFSIATFNYFRIRRLSDEAPQKLADSIQVEFRNKCIINMLHLAFIFSSFYREDEVGRWIFALSVIVQSTFLLLFYTSKYFWQGQSVPTKPTVCLTTKLGRRLDYIFRNCWNKIFTPYSGVAKGEETEHCGSFRGSKDLSVNISEDISSSNNEDSTRRNVSKKLNGPWCDCIIDGILVHRPPSSLEDCHLKHNRHKNVTNGSQYVCMGQLELERLSDCGSPYQKNFQNREYQNCVTDGDGSLFGSKCGKQSVEGIKISNEKFLDKSLLKMSPFACKNPNLAYFSVKSNSFLPAFSSKFSLSGKNKFLGKTDNFSCPPPTSFENCSVNYLPRNTFSDRVNASQKHLPSRNREWVHRRQHSL